MRKFKLKFTSDLIVNTLCTITVGAGIVEYSTNIFFNDLYVKYFKEEYKNGNPVALSESLRKRYDDVIHDLKFTDFQKAFSIPFAANDFNTVNVGCLNTRTGCYIGIPSIYNLNANDDTSILNNEHIQENVRLMTDKSTDGQKFRETLILSEPAQKFSIARELILTDNLRIFIKSISMSIVLLPMYALGNTILSLLPPNPFKVRVLAFFLLCNAGIFVWYFVRNTIENFYLFDADKKLCNTGEEYILGGIEYYDKLIQRNLALRNILPGGENIYTEQGNEIALLPMFSKLSLTYRKQFLEHKLKNYINEKKNLPS